MKILILLNSKMHHCNMQYPYKEVQKLSHNHVLSTVFFTSYLPLRSPALPFFLSNDFIVLSFITPYSFPSCSFFLSFVLFMIFPSVLFLFLFSGHFLSNLFLSFSLFIFLFLLFLSLLSIILLLIFTSVSFSFFLVFLFFSV
jgi:hypothetical protein